jgi:hypothetical protein
MTDNSQSILALDLQLSEQEMLAIGMIVAHWGALEHEVFMQTLRSFDEAQVKADELPKAMNNMQFTQVLDMWKERVADKCKGKRATVLHEVHHELLTLKEPRDALVHGMWYWSPENLHQVSTMRIKKREVMFTHFDPEYLQDFALRLAKLNFRIRYPRGVTDLVASQKGEGARISRKLAQLMTETASAGVNSTTGENRDTHFSSP